MTNELNSVYRRFWRRVVFFAFMCLSLVAGSSSSARAQSQSSSSSGSTPPDFLVILPHTHWEGAVFKTREEYLQVGLPHIMKALSLMQRYPNYRYVLDQMAYVKPFLERYPNDVPFFKKM